MPSGRGDFDGQGHGISGLKINVDESDNPRQFEYAGLFGRIVTAGTVKNLRLVNVDIKGNDNVGALGGYISGERTVENCYVTGSVAGQNYVGGLVGNLVRAGEGHSLVVKNSYSTCKVTGSDNVGGLVGYKEKSKISNCYATGDVVGKNNVGGLVGYGTGENNIYSVENCYATGNISGAENVGGLVGLVEADKVTHCYATGGAEGRNNVGDLVGKLDKGKVIYSVAWNLIIGSNEGGVVNEGYGIGENYTFSYVTDGLFDLQNRFNDYDNKGWVSFPAYKNGNIRLPILSYMPSFEADIEVDTTEGKIQRLIYTDGGEQLGDGGPALNRNPVLTEDGVKIIEFQGELVIPNVVDDIELKRIANNAFEGYTGITGITIPASVTAIGDSAFAGCTNIEEIRFLEIACLS